VRVDKVPSKQVCGGPEALIGSVQVGVPFLSRQSLGKACLRPKRVVVGAGRRLPARPACGTQDRAPRSSRARFECSRGISPARTPTGARFRALSIRRRLRTTLLANRLSSPRRLRSARSDLGAGRRVLQNAASRELLAGALGFRGPTCSIARAFLIITQSIRVRAAGLLRLSRIRDGSD
jgi:hypothetical protein